MTIETSRLVLTPLTVEQLGLLTGSLPELEAQLHCRYEGEPIAGPFREIVAGQMERAAADPDNWLYHTFWLLITKGGGFAVGSASLKAPPDDGGEVEIGYGLGINHRGSGYMAEGVAALCRWALKQPKVSAVVAETDGDNLASHNVLRRCGFTRHRDVDTMVWWRLEA